MRNEVEITLPDGSKLTVPRGTAVSEIVGKMGHSRDGWIAAKLNGRLVDLTRKVEEDAALEGVGTDSQAGLEILRHSAAHIMAQAVKSIFPEALVCIGPAIENGFYYDFDVPRPFTQDDLEKIEANMREITSQKLPFSRREVPREEAIGFFSGLGEKVQGRASRRVYRPGRILLPAGGFHRSLPRLHIPHSGLLKAFKLTSVAGAYWRGDERNPMLQRIMDRLRQGVAKKILTLLEEAQRRDHRRLGRNSIYSVSRTMSAPGWLSTTRRGRSFVLFWRTLKDASTCAEVIRSWWARRC